MVGSAIMMGRRVTAIVSPRSATHPGDAPTVWENTGLWTRQIPSAPISAAELNTFFEFQIKHTGEATARRDVKRWHLPAP
jgi:hypothetical protein